MAARVKLNHAAISALLRGPEVHTDLERRARSIAATAAAASGKEFVGFVDTHHDRAIAHVTYVDGPTTFGLRSEAKHGWLTSAMGAGK